MKKILCILLLLSVCNVFPQKISELYKRYIPKNVFLDRNNGRAIKDNIDSYVSINPDLLYYYLAYLDNKYKKRIEDPEKNQLNLFNSKLNESLYKRSEWLITQIKENESSAQLCIIKKRIKDFNENYLFEGSQLSANVNNQGVLVDSNKMDYFSYIYFSKENVQEYDANIKYIDLINKTLITKIAKINTDIESLPAISSKERKETITKLLNYWYIIGESSYPKYLISTNKNTVKEIIKYIPNDYAIKYQVLVNAGYVVSESSKKKLYNVNNTYMPTGEKSILFNFILPVEVKVKKTFSAGLGVIIPLRDELSAFSYVKLKGNYYFINADIAQPRSNKNLYTYTYKRESMSLSYYYQHRSNEVANYKNYAISLQAYTPLLYSSNKFIFNGGLTFKYKKLSFDYPITVDNYRLNDFTSTLLESKKFIKNTSESSSTVSPSILIEYKVMKPVRIYTDGIIYLKGGIDIMVGLEVALDF